MAKGFLYTFLLFAYIVGAIGGFGYSAWNGTWFVAVCVLILAVMAAPTAYHIFQEWTK